MSVAVTLDYHSTIPINTIPTSYKITPRGIHLISLTTFQFLGNINVELRCIRGAIEYRIKNKIRLFSLILRIW